MNTKLVFLFLLIATTALGSVHKSVDRDTLMSSVFRFANENQDKIGHAEAETYIKYNITTKRKNIALRLIPGMQRLERGTNTYLGESMLQFNFSKPSIIDIREMASYSTMPSPLRLSDRYKQNVTYSIYSPTLMQNKLLSPLNERNKRYYKYTLDSITTSEGTRIKHISVTPRIFNTQLVTGHFSAITSGSITKFMFRAVYNQTHIKVEGFMGKGDLLELLPQELNLSFSFRLLGNEIKTTFKTYSTFNEVYSSGIMTPNPSNNNFDLSYLNRLKVDTSKTMYSKEFFDQHRPEKLSAEELSVYLSKEKADSIKSQNKKEADKEKKKEKAPFFSESMEDLLLGKHSFGKGNEGVISIPPIITPSMIQWSKSQGISMQTQIKYYNESCSERVFKAATHIGYNFKQSRLYWKIPVSYTFSPSNNGKIIVEVGNGNRIYSSKQADEIRDKLSGTTNYDSLQNVFSSYNFNYFKDFYANAAFSIEPLNGLTLQTGLVYHSRTMENWNKEAEKSGLSRKYESLAPHLRLVFTPQYYYYRRGKQKQALYSYYPTFALDYERGIKIGTYKNEYERWEADISYKIPLYALRSLYIRTGAGFYTTQKETYFVDFSNFNYNGVPNGWDDELSGEFQLLSSHWYNESNYYIRASAAYCSPMMLLSRLKCLSRYVQSESIYCNALVVNALKPYIEIGYGISTHIAEYAVFTSIANGSPFGFGAKIALHLFDE